MIDFANCTESGKFRRIRRLADLALSRYDIDVVTVRKHAFATNLLYRVVSASGERFMLRFAYPGWRTVEDLRAEATWLDALHADTDIGAPRVLRSKAGESVLPMQGLGVPHTWHASLMTWVDGRLLAHHLTTANLWKMGELFARLHVHGREWTPPAGFSTRRFDAFLSRGESDELFGGDAGRALPDGDRRSLRHARRWVEEEYAALDPDDLRVIHGDLWHENVKCDEERLRPFDFEDTIWGFRLHDLAMGLLDLLETVGSFRYPDLLAAFREGYESRLEWPAGNLSVLQVGRMLWQLNYAARVRPDSLASKARGYARAFNGFERTGTLRVPG